MVGKIIYGNILHDRKGRVFHVVSVQLSGTIEYEDLFMDLKNMSTGEIVRRKVSEIHDWVDSGSLIDKGLNWR